MSTKHIVNDPKDLVVDSLTGLVRADPNILLDVYSRVTYLKEIPQERVALISGGGSGHEPSHGAMVGPGLLSAAVAGNVFASPNVGQIRRGIDLVDNKKGTLIVIMRYTGDVLLFGLAKEQGAVTKPDHPIRLTIVGDDVAVPRSQGALVGRRGLAGTILVYKIASALADTGADVEAVHSVAEYVSKKLGTIGVGLEHCHIPGTAVGESHLSADEVEIGMGIHNEAGILKEKVSSSKELVSKLLNYIVDTTDKERAFVDFAHDGSDEVILLVNNLGSISNLELTSIVNDAVLELKSKKISVVRIVVGSFMTSLNLPGFSLTTLLLPKANDSEYSRAQILELFDAPASAFGWKNAQVSVGTPESVKAAEPAPRVIKSGAAPVSYNLDVFTKAVTAAAERVIAAEPEITRYDTIAGDGDCGLCLKAGATGILSLLSSGSLDSSDLVTAILQIAQVIEKEMDGTSGALYSIWSNALAAGLAKAAGSAATSAVWAQALAHALAVLYDYTAARRPSRTLIDPLQAFTDAFAKSNGADFPAAVKAGQDAANETKDLVAKAGRAAYVGREELQKAQVPDPGAWGVYQILAGILSSL